MYYHNLINRQVILINTVKYKEVKYTRRKLDQGKLVR